MPAVGGVLYRTDLGACREAAPWVFYVSVHSGHME